VSVRAVLAPSPDPDHEPCVTLRPGDVVAERYTVERVLGRGGMAEVVAARDRTLERDVALKVLAPHLLDDAAAHDRFLREARAAAALAHPRVVALHDVVPDDGHDVMVMQLVPGPSLAERLRDHGPLSAGEAVEIADQVAEGLAAAHARGLVHRDVKPSNVLFDRDGGAMIADFGIAVAANASATMTGAVRGSLPYVAPEQVRGDPADPRSDLYALGCVLFEMLTGRVPFPAESPAAALGQHLHRDPPAPSTLVATVPPALDAVVAQLLVKEPAERFPDAPSLRAALRAIDLSGETLAGAPAAAATTVVSDRTTTAVLDDTPAPASVGASEPERGGRPWAWVAAGVLAVAAVALVAALASGPEPPALQTAPVPSPSATATTPAPPSPTPATPTATEETPESLPQAVAAFRRDLSEGQREGLATEKAARELEDRVSEVLEEDRDRDDDDRGAREVAKQIDEVRKELGKNVEKGEVDEGLADRLDDWLDAMEALLA
jgi:tRNA A-37 threonylcarbamoyl transferase component Bud32